FESSGWSFDYAIGAMPPGSHDVSASASNSAGHSVFLGTQTISVNASFRAPFGRLDFAGAAGGGDVLDAHSTLLVQGWAADPVANHIAEVDILIDGAPVGAATLGGPITGLPAFENSQSYPNQSWTLTVSASGL